MTSFHSFSKQPGETGIEFPEKRFHGCIERHLTTFSTNFAVEVDARIGKTSLRVRLSPILIMILQNPSRTTLIRYE
jgi:hypothetical protein